MGKTRIDKLLTDLGFFESREKAKRAVMAGQVFLGGTRIDKPGTLLADQDVEVSDIEVKGAEHPYVSRGGLKLAKALEEFKVEVRGRVVLDVGASTGGFTDCLLQNGASRVIAVDVGYGQLAWQLRTDPRVVVMERTNIRHLSAERLGVQPDMAVVDVSFISLTKFFDHLLQLISPAGCVITLVKPQFEVGRESVGKKGVVRDWQVHARFLPELLGQLQASGAGLRALTYSPIRGPEGDVEYLAYFDKTFPAVDAFPLASKVVQKAKEDLS